MQIAWRAAVDEPALKMPAAELNTIRDQVAITSARRRRTVRRGAQPPNSVGLRQNPHAAGRFVGVGARSKIPVQSVDGAPRDQDAQNERGRSRCHDLPPAGPIHLHASLELVCSLGGHIDTDSPTPGNTQLS